MEWYLPHVESEPLVSDPSDSESPTMTLEDVTIDPCENVQHPDKSDDSPLDTSAGLGEDVMLDHDNPQTPEHPTDIESPAAETRETVKSIALSDLTEGSYLQSVLIMLCKVINFLW